MQEKIITKRDLRKHIIKYYNHFKGRFWNFIELTTKGKLSKSVEDMFIFKQGNYIGKNWYDGNEKLQEFINQTIKQK